MLRYFKYIGLVFAILFSVSVNLTAQLILYQNIHHGGVTGSGYSLGVNSNEQTSNFEVFIEPNSSILKAYIISYRAGNPEPLNLIFNGQPFSLNNNTQVGNDFQVVDNSPVSPYNFCNVHLIDVTNAVNSSQTIYPFTIPSQQSTQFTGRYVSFYLIIIYENNLLDKTNFLVLINEINSTPNVFYQFDNINPIISNFDVGFSINSDILWNVVNDGTYIYLNNNLLGLIGGNDQLNAGAGVKGDFFYQNSTLSALGNDFANNEMNGTDGLANIDNFVSNNSNTIELNLLHQSTTTKYNIYTSFHFSYTTPCDTFSTTLTDNIIVCKGTQAQLNASGGIAYEWLPQVGLSCYNCPNPIVTADSINHYTCRIWNTDSCSKVLPVKINILPLPSMPTIVVDPTLCSGNTGHIEITNQPTPYTYTLDGGIPQTTLHFNNLTAGSHILQIATNNGCSIDTILTVAEVNNVVAQFTASPTRGDVPLTVNFTNQSANATNYSWYIENDTLNTTQANHTFDTSGVFSVTLVAYNNFPQCSDTATVTIVAEYPFTIIAPSLYVGDENYSTYQIYTSGVTELHYELFTDQGKLVYNKVLLPTNGNLSLWNSNQLAKGIYFYRIWAVDDDGIEKVITGKVVVI